MQAVVSDTGALTERGFIWMGADLTVERDESKAIAVITFS